MTKKIKIQAAPFEGNFTREEISAVVKAVRQEQYGGISEMVDVKPKDPHTEKEKILERKIVELNERITTQYKVIDKLVRDVKRLKDQVSELAGRIPSTERKPRG